jgi:DNA invertase Pin-like site-specific DNA recombinase
MAMYAYVRCSTSKQDVLGQLDRLREAGCDRIFKDKAVNATARNRPGLRDIRKALRPNKDTFVVVAVDRAFRSTFEAIAFLDDLTAHGIAFRSLEQNIDPRTLEGRRWYISKANDAEYERGVISRRTREAMAAAKRRGKKFGRPRKLTKAKIARARAAVRNRGCKSMDQVAKSLRISRRSLFRALR